MDISFGQSRLAKLEAQANERPEVRSGRVTALARAISDGTYQVSPEQTAEAVMSEMMARSAHLR
jgi:anti-sigma28 factor (negative regulator of flagellin synthesis)